MEDYIYILVGVIWLAASVYNATKKNKKKAASPSKESARSESKSGMTEARSLLDELLGGQDVRIPAPHEEEHIYEPDIFEAETETPTPSFQREYTNMGLKGLEALSGEEIKTTDRIEFIDEMKSLKKRGRRQNKIDLRKAIIYSAILERPYT